MKFNPGIENERKGSSCEQVIKAVGNVAYQRREGEPSSQGEFDVPHCVGVCQHSRGLIPSPRRAHEPTKTIVFLGVNLRACASITCFTNAGKEFAWRVLRKAPEKCDRRSPRFLTQSRPMSSSRERLRPGLKTSPADRGSCSVALKSYGMGTWDPSHPEADRAGIPWD